MNFISTSGMTNETAPEGEVLVQYLEPSFGGWSVEFAIAYFDNPNDYTDGNGEGWKHWITGNQINVLAYSVLPDSIKTKLTEMDQLQFREKFGTGHYNLGSVGEFNY